MGRGCLDGLDAASSHVQRRQHCDALMSSNYQLAFQNPHAFVYIANSTFSSVIVQPRSASIPPCPSLHTSCSHHGLH